MAAEQKRILVTDDSQVVVQTLERTLTELGYEVLVAFDGEECVSLARQYKPSLAFIDLTLPKAHGIDVLKQLKSDPDTEPMGVVISTGRAMSQDYSAAIEHGACYYLTKPFLPEAIASIVQRFFAKTLKPAPFSIGELPDVATSPQADNNVASSYAKLWGTRGSIPVAGAEYARYGGNTPCLELWDQSELVVIDAGTGIRQLGNEVLTRDVRTIHLVIGHTHWDHILGFPFFAPIYNKEFTIHIYAAPGGNKSIPELFTGMLDHDYFPVRLDEMQAEFVFHSLEDDAPLEFESFKLHYDYSNHPGPTLCFKIETDKQTIGYATDNEMLLGYHGHPNKVDIDHPLLAPNMNVVEFFKGCDVLIHEAQYTAEDYQQKVGWGHSSVSNAAALVKFCEAPEWIVTHHDPAHTDAHLEHKLAAHEACLRECNVDCRVRMAHDGLVLPL